MESDGERFKTLHAPRTEAMFKHISEAASGRGMVVNDSKTIILCMSDAISHRPQARIFAGGDPVDSSDKMRVLGFIFLSAPTATCSPLHSRTWALTKLKRAGFTEVELVRFYCGAIRPVAEYASPAFHSLTPGHLSQALERQQNQALKHIFGPGLSAAEMRRRASIPTL